MSNASMGHFLVLFFLFALLIVAIYLLNKEIRNAQIEFVKANSTAYASLLDLNSIVHFHSLPAVIPIVKECNSKVQFEKLNGRNYLVDLATQEQEMFEQLVSQTKYNRKILEMYQEDLRALTPTAETSSQKIGNMNAARFWEIEKDLCVNGVFHPVVNAKINLTIQYVSAQRRNVYSRTETYSVEQIESILHDVEERRRFKESKQYQRSIMTPSLRYRVLQRDMFRCVLCGASSADGAKLEVDHIIPISKGGKTEFSNLRTLCQDCNRGKRDRYDPNGVN